MGRLICTSFGTEKRKVQITSDERGRIVCKAVLEVDEQ